jgi:predicted nucleic acid-binding protein
VRSAILDTGPLLSLIDIHDPQHQRMRQFIERAEFQIVIPTMVVAESCYLIETRLGPVVESQFLSGLTETDVEAPTPDEWRRIAELVSIYRDFPLGAVDASVIVLAERLNTDLIVTLDQRHFRAVRPRHAEAFRLLPD